MNEFLQVHKVCKSYDGGLVAAVRGVTFTVDAGEVVALMGPSGCGKSTLLTLVGALDKADSGHIHIDGKELDQHRPIHLFRAQSIGFVFQFHHLVPSLTLMENVETPMVGLGMNRRDRRERALSLLEEVNLVQRASFYPARVSGGERQRAAIARALANSPRLLLADEPTGNLDSVTGKQVMELMLARSRQHATTVILATHNPEIANAADRIVTMRDGEIVTA